MTWAYVFPMALTVLSNVAYHFCQKGIPGGVDPTASLVVTYATALLASVFALLVFGAQQEGVWAASTWSRLNWASVVLGLAAVGLELGFLLAYRSGWKLGTAAFYSNALVTLMLIPLGILLFGEAMTLKRGVGLLLALSGLWVLS